MIRPIARLLDLLFPRDCVCLGCNRQLVDDTHRQLCLDCAQALQPPPDPRCPICSRPTPAPDQPCNTCSRIPPELRLFGTAAYLHAQTAQKLVHRLKFDQVREAAVPLAMGMLETMPSGMDALVPVPLHRSRLRTRGFNQAALLCNLLSEWTDLPVLDALARPRPTREQSKLHVQARWKNTENAFTLREDVYRLRLLLVDDVRTTGATAIACATALYHGGAREIRLLTATVAVQDEERDGQGAPPPGPLPKGQSPSGLPL